MHFDLSRYDFSFPRYHLVKKRIIFNRFCYLFGSLVHWSISSFKEMTDAIPGNVVYMFPRKISRPLGRRPIHNFCIVLSAMETSNVYISATDWDIGIKQKSDLNGTRVSLFPDYIPDNETCRDNLFTCDCKCYRDIKFTYRNNISYIKK